MTELQIGLLGLGATAVVGVVTYNAWQEYRHRKIAEQVLKTQHTDVLLDEPDVGESDPAYVDNAPEIVSDVEEGETAAIISSPAIAEAPTMPISHGERIEPVLRLDPEPELREPTLAAQELQAEAKCEVESEAEADIAMLVPEPEEPPQEAASIPVQSPAETKEAIGEIPAPLHLLSPAIDYLASFEAVEPTPAYQILQSQREALARIRKPIHWIGFNETTREWESLEEEGGNEYRCIQVGLQLVDRQGPVSDGELTVFHNAMQDLADQMMAITDFPPHQPALEAAAKLDEFCASVDIQIGINVISQGLVFPGTKLRALAEAAGMVIDAEGRFVRCDDDGNVLYVLLNQEAAGFSVDSMKTMTTHGVTFLLDVPRVSHGERVFNQMVELARRFAEVLRGALVDDNHRPLSEKALEPIRRQVGQYQSMLAARKLPAGSPLTQRLFS